MKGVIVVTKSDIEKCEALERRAWELQQQAQQVAGYLSGVVHDTAMKSSSCLRKELRVAQGKKPNAARSAYVKARSASLKAIMKLQLDRAVRDIEQLRLAVKAMADDVELGPLLDSCPE